VYVSSMHQVIPAKWREDDPCTFYPNWNCTRNTNAVICELQDVETSRGRKIADIYPWLRQPIAQWRATRGKGRRFSGQRMTASDG
jgi:hypothetical protein